MTKRSVRKIAEESIVFTPDEAVDATKDFEGYIVDAEYGLSPLGMSGRADIEQKPQLCIQIRTETYERDQYEPCSVEYFRLPDRLYRRGYKWFAPSKVKLTKWFYFLDAMNKTGALKDTISSGKNAAEKMKNFAKSLMGMNFRWLERMNLEAVATPIKRLLLPEEYLGKVEVQKTEEIETEEVVLD